MAAEDSEVGESTGAGADGNAVHDISASGGDSSHPSGIAPNAIVRAGLRMKLEILEAGDQIEVDISDNTGGLCLRLTFAPWEATRLGTALAERARALVSRAKDAPERTEVTKFEVEDAEVLQV